MRTLWVVGAKCALSEALCEAYRFQLAQQIWDCNLQEALRNSSLSSANSYHKNFSGSRNSQFIPIALRIKTSYSYPASFVFRKTTNVSQIRWTQGPESVNKKFYLAFSAVFRLASTSDI